MGDSIGTDGGNPVLTGDEGEVDVAPLCWSLALASTKFAGARLVWVGTSLDIMGYNLFGSGRWCQCHTIARFRQL